MRPPARLYHAGPTEWMTPSRTETLASSAPKASTSAPGCGSAAIKRGRIHSSVKPESRNIGTGIAPR